MKRSTLIASLLVVMTIFSMEYLHVIHRLAHIHSIENELRERETTERNLTGTLIHLSSKFADVKHSPSSSFDTNPELGPLPINLYPQYASELAHKLNWGKSVSPRFEDFSYTYREKWKVNGVPEFSEHAFLEPEWTIRVKCPNHSKTYQEEKKKLGVYVCITDMSKGKMHREGMTLSGNHLDFYGAVRNWREFIFAKHPHTFLIFHYGSLLPHVESFVRRELDGIDMEVKFIEVSVKTFLGRKTDGKKFTSNNNYWGISVFYVNDLFKHPAMQHYEYYMRFDDDFRFVEPVRYDLFKFMKENNLDVGFSLLGMPDNAYGEWTAHFQERVWAYFLKLGILPLEEMKVQGKFGSGDTIHAGPFEVGRISVYNNANYDHFIESLDIWEGVQKYHWSEQNIKTQWIKMYIPRRSLHWFCDLHTFHKLYFRPRCTIKCL